MRAPVIDAHATRLLAALWYPFTSSRRTLLTAIVAAAIYCLSVLSSFPTYTVQLLGADLRYGTDALLALTANTYQTAGASGLALIVGYAILIGVALTAAVSHVRVVGVRDQDADDYHLYITNLPRSEFLPCDLATIYRCRWEVELLFRELKTRYKLDEFDTTKKHIVNILVYAALLTLIVSRTLLDLVTEHAEGDAVFPPAHPA